MFNGHSPKRLQHRLDSIDHSSARQMSASTFTSMFLAFTRENVSNDITLEILDWELESVRGDRQNDTVWVQILSLRVMMSDLVMNGVSMSDDVSQVVEYHNPEARQIG
jgi:hypothetical protein